MPFDRSVDPRATFPAGAISSWRGSYASLPAAMLKPPTEGNRTIPMAISWLRDGQSPSYAIQFNARMQQVLNFTQICSIHVDNTRCSSNINIVFPDTGFQVQLHANSEGFYPVLTNGLEFIAFVDLQPVAGDTTVIQVMNFLPPPIEFGGIIGGSGVGTLRQVDTVAPIQGGPITDTGSISLAVPLAINFGGTAAITRNVALDNLSATSGTTAGAMVRSAGGVWSVSAVGVGTITGVSAGNGLSGGGTSGTVTIGIAQPVSVANGGTGGIDAPTARTNLGAAPLNGPAFTGTPSLVTPPALSDNTSAIVTAAWVKSQGYGAGNGTITGVTAGNNLTGGGTSGIVTLNLAQPLTGPVTVNGAFTGNGTGQFNNRLTVSYADDATAQFVVAGTTNRFRILTSGSNVTAQAVNSAMTLTVPFTLSGNGISLSSDATIFLSVPPGAANQVQALSTNGDHFRSISTGGGTWNRLWTQSPTRVWNFGPSPADFNLWDDTAAALRLSINTAGACFNGTGTWSAFSDIALKENVTPYTRGLAAITQLQPVSFDYIAGTPFARAAGDPAEPFIGLVAQEVQPIIPEICGTTVLPHLTPPEEGETRTDTTVATLRPGDLIFALINAVKELTARIEQLEAAP